MTYMNKDSRIIVTGAAGLAGSAVVEHLKENGYSNVAALTKRVADLRDIHETKAIFAEIQPEFVYHAAALVYGLIGNMNNQGKSIFENTLINTNVIEACHWIGVKKIVAMGTNCIYPDPPVLPYREDRIFDGRPHPGESAYGHAKRHMLAMLEAYHESYGLDYAYIVSGNLFGPRDKFDPVNGHVMPSLIFKFYNAKVYGDDVELWGDGSASRDFLYCKDLARIVEASFWPGPPNVFNTGSGHSITIAGVAKLLSEISGVSMDRVKFDTSKPNGRPYCVSDLSQLFDAGFTPLWTLQAGLKETWDWYCADQDKKLPPWASV